METKNCMKAAPREVIAAELELRIKEGNLKCACCLSNYLGNESLNPKQKLTLVDAIIANSQIDSRTQTWIDDRVHPEC